MGNTFSNAAVMSTDIEDIKRICKIQPPLEESGIVFQYSSFYLFPPLKGWTVIMAPEEHPANSYLLAKAVSLELKVPAFAGFVSHSTRMGMRFLKDGKIIFNFRNGLDEGYFGEGEFAALNDIFKPIVLDTYTSLEDMFKSEHEFIESLYGQVIHSFGLPPFLGDYGFRYIGKADDDNELDEIFGEDFLP